MASKFGTGWQKIQQHTVRSAIILGVGLLGIILLVAFIGGYFFHWDWTGFNSGTSQITITRGTPTSTSKVDYTAIVSQPSKSLWDWLNLLGVLAIPAAVGLGTIWFTRQQAKVSDAENRVDQRETALQAYIDRMSELLLEKQLRDSAENEEVRK